MRNWGRTVDSPLIMFLIEGGEPPVIVDTGGDAGRARTLHNLKFEQTNHELPGTALRNAGVDPDDVEIVVNTHLHWDHSSNNHLFRNARVIVQEGELAFARKPVVWHEKQFEVSQDVAAAWRQGEHQVAPVAGDVEIARELARR